MDACFEQALVKKHGLSCRGFYNYFDEDSGCATTEDEKLASLYSDPEGVKELFGIEIRKVCFSGYDDDQASHLVRPPVQR